VIKRIVITKKQEITIGLTDNLYFKLPFMDLSTAEINQI
jgi:hypothetical protein